MTSQPSDSAVDLAVDEILARVARIERGRAWLWADAQEFEVDLALYSQPHDVAVGDWLVLSQQPGQHLPLRRLPRHSLLARRAAGERADTQLIAANIDTLFIVSSCNADFSLERLERYLALALDGGIRAVVVLTKADLVPDAAGFVEQAEALGGADSVLAIDAHRDADVDALRAWCGEGQTVAMVGSSGVGKSTLINRLLGRAVQPTQAARDEDAKGRHTTTSRSMHRLADGGLIIDTPGMRELQLPACEDGLASLFAEIQPLLGRCRFNDCQHLHEPGCAIQAAIAAGELSQRRWDSYCKMQTEQARNAQSMAERRDSQRRQTRSYRQYQKHARGNKGRRY